MFCIDRIIVKNDEKHTSNLNASKCTTFVSLNLITLSPPEEAHAYDNVNLIDFCFF